jgi:hypothetical protein
MDGTPEATTVPRTYIRPFAVKLRSIATFSTTLQSQLLISSMSMREYANGFAELNRVGKQRKIHEHN